MKILILGASGMLGNAMMRVMAATGAFRLVPWRCGANRQD
jgi:dTDP-4-dehydrorhamnose reductase